MTTQERIQILKLVDGKARYEIDHMVVNAQLLEYFIDTGSAFPPEKIRPYKEPEYKDASEIQQECAAPFVEEAVLPKEDVVAEVPKEDVAPPKKKFLQILRLQYLQRIHLG